MIYKDFQGVKLSNLGFGTMRLPLNQDGSIDQKQVEEMTDYAIEHGVNYFDTAYPYHGGKSEVSIGMALKKYPRDSFYLADKFPGHQHTAFDAQEIFEEQLKKCQVEYFDFYLLHNVNESSLPDYLENHPEWIQYFIEQRKNGRIKHLGFSAHARVENLRKFLELWGKEMEFCQIQFNYLDYSLQNAKEKIDLLDEYNIPVWVMEPVRGGKLAQLNEQQMAKLKAIHPEVSAAEWGFRYIQQFESVTVCLSGMSNFEQMKQNVATFSTQMKLSAEELNDLYEIADGMKVGVPCTACRYCCDGCPMELDIPTLLSMYNQQKIEGGMTVIMQIEAMKPEEMPHACIGCGQCTSMCPQQIDVPTTLAELADIYDHSKKWSEICKEREEIAKKNKAEKQ